MAEEREGVFDRRHRALTVGAVLAVSIVAFEALALATVAPEIARDLGGIDLYGWIFSAFVLPALIGPAIAGFIAEQFTWRAVFYGLLPFLIAVGLLTASSLLA